MAPAGQETVGRRAEVHVALLVGQTLRGRPSLHTCGQSEENGAVTIIKMKYNEVRYCGGSSGSGR